MPATTGTRPCAGRGSNPRHPDHEDVLDKSHDDWTYYLRTIRPMLGWSLFVGQKTAG